MPPTTRGIRAVRGTQKIGEKLAQAMQKVGNEGVITVEEAKSLTTELEVVEGQCSSTAATSRPLCHQCREMIAELENPYILLHEKKLSGLQAMLPLLETVVQSGRLLLIVAEDVEGEALATLLVNKLRGGLRLKRGAGCTRPRVRSGRFIMPRRRAEARTLAVGNVLVPRDSEKQNGGVGLGKVCHVQSKVLHTAGSCSADGVAAAKAALPPNWTN